MAVKISGVYYKVYDICTPFTYIRCVTPTTKIQHKNRTTSLLTGSCIETTEPTLVRLSLRLALLAVGLVISGMSIPVEVEVQAERFLQGATSTLWLRGTPNTGPPLPAPVPPVGASRSLSKTNYIEVPNENII